jgi:P-type E1-E2 ATPase
LEFVGITAVNDELQENVGETLENFREAGVRVWVLTGD